MAWTARGEEGKKEYFDTPEELERKVQQLAEWIRESKHFFVFTVSVCVWGGGGRVEGGMYVGREGSICERNRRREPLCKQEELTSVVVLPVYF